MRRAERDFVCSASPNYITESILILEDGLVRKFYTVFISSPAQNFMSKLILPFSQKQIKEANEFLSNEMGQLVNRASRDKIPINLSKDEIQTYIKRFQIIDADRKGYVSINDIRRSLKVLL